MKILQVRASATPFARGYPSQTMGWPTRTWGSDHIFHVLQPKTDMFPDGRALSWYADKDRSNVGQSSDWITADELSQQSRIATAPTAQIFKISKDENECVTPTSFTKITMSTAATEGTIVSDISKRNSFLTDYYRLPNSD